MATTSNHGGGCCGARHIYTFRDGDERNAQSLVENLLDNGRIENHHLAEVILSNRQATENPQLIAKLAETGFVYSSSWTGNHGTPVHRFERTGRRLALSANRFNWNGMMSSANLEGEMPSLTRQAGARNARRIENMSVRELTEYFAEGTRHRVTSPNSNFLDHTVVSRGFRNGRVTFMANGGRMFYHRPSSFAAPQEIQQPNLEGQRHGERATAPAPHQEAPRRLLNEYFALFQDGRMRGPFGSRAGCREAYPRVRRFVRRQVMSDGTIITSDPTTFYQI